MGNLVANLAARASSTEGPRAGGEPVLWIKRLPEKDKSDSHGGHACPERSIRVDSDREKREAEFRREAELGRIDGSPVGVRRAGEHRVERASQDTTRQAAHQGTREALEEKEQDQQGGGGLYGSQIDASHLVGAAIAELVGTFILVFGGTAVAVGAILARPTAGPAYDSLAVALAFGLALAAVVAAVGHVSGAHVNPAVTLGMAAAGKFPWNYAPVYIGAQLVGAVLAALATWLTFGGAGARSEARLAATYPAQGVGDLQAFLVEILITFILVFVVMAVATDERAPAAIAPIAVGFALAVGVFIAGPVTGGSVNPARSLGPMIVAGDLTSVWLYVLGPIIGGVLGALLYDRFMAQTEAPA
jgi:MIP family channel proteins